jgi:hypothetical protein
MQTIGQRENRSCSEIRLMRGQIFTLDNSSSESKKVKSKDLTLKSKNPIDRGTQWPMGD